MTFRSLLSRALTAMVVASAALIAASGAAHAKSDTQSKSSVLRATLANGLRVVIVRNTLAPVVATAVNYLVGSDEAPAGFPGMAHAQEHMMFRGSPGINADQLADIGGIMGGNFNANTRESLTQYLYTVPSKDLDVALNIEALRMRDVLDTEDDWRKERGAIEQEVAQDMSNPFYVLYARLRTELFSGTPYAHDALGTRPSFEKTTAAMLREFHEKWYAPNNAILVIAGDIAPKAVLRNVRRLFGSIPSQKLPPRPQVKLAPFVATSLVMKTDRPNATQILAFRMPGLNSPDFPALEILADVLQSQRSDLYGLVVRGTAIGTEFALDPLPKAGLAYAAVSFPAQGAAQNIDTAMRSILKKIAVNGVSPALVAAAKIQERRQTEFQKNSIAGLASVWSDAVALYGLASPQADLARIDKVSASDVDRVARKYLDLSNAISVTMEPENSGRPVMAGAAFGGQESISLGESKPSPLPSWAEADLGRLSLPASTLRPVVSRLPNGLTLIVQSESVSDTVSIFGHIRNRPDTEEPPGKEGVSLLLDRLFSFGTTNLDRIAFQEALDRIGASESAGTDFSIRSLGEDFETAARLLADNELHPALPESALEALKPTLAQAVAARDQSPGFLAQRSLRTALYSPEDPSVRQASRESILSISEDDIRSYYARVLRPDLTTIVVIGNIAPRRAKAVIEKYFDDWQASGPVPQTDLPTAPPNATQLITVPDDSRVQDLVYVAQNLALTRSDPDYYALALGNAALGGGFYSTRLSIDLRKESGLVYSVNSEIESGRTRSAFLIRYACDPDNVQKAAQMVSNDVASMGQTPISADELLRAKALILRRISLSEASVNAIAQGFLTRSDLDLPLDEPRVAAERYLSLSSSDVQSAFRKWMRPDDMVRVSQGPVPQ